jgi:hypothetical protein
MFDVGFSSTMGQLFMMGFDGTTVTPEIRQLIEEHHLGSILLTAKNLKCESPHVGMTDLPDDRG